MSEIEHGTYAGSQKCHDGKDGKRCDPCRLAGNAYIKNYRQKNPESVKRQCKRENLMRKAARILAKRHKKEFEDILNTLLKGEQK